MRFFWQVLCEYDGDNVYKNFYIYGNYIDEVLFIAPGVKWYVHDHLYSPVALVYYDGTVKERYEYDAYGDCDILEANFADDPDGKSDYDNPYFFTGRRVDILDNGSLKLQYNRNRYYDQYTGRWLTHDPLGITPNPQKPNRFALTYQYNDGLSLYEYVRSSPIMSVDSFGLYMPGYPIMIPKPKPEPGVGKQGGGSPGFLPWGTAPPGLLFPAIGRLCMSKSLMQLGAIIKEGRKQIPDYPSATGIPGDSFPYKHCVWACKMAKDIAKGEHYARDIGRKKEKLDEAVKDWANTLGPVCWAMLGTWLQEQIGAWVCSAQQGSDYDDNESGIKCGSKLKYKYITCIECCEDKMKISRNAEEGNADRPYGRFCKGRYRKAVERKWGRPVVVEGD